MDYSVITHNNKQFYREFVKITNKKTPHTFIVSGVSFNFKKLLF